VSSISWACRWTAAGFQSFTELLAATVAVPSGSAGLRRRPPSLSPSSSGLELIADPRCAAVELKGMALTHWVC